MKNFLASSRSKYLLALGVFAIGVGVVSKKVISYPTECSPMKNQKIELSFKTLNNSIFQKTFSA